MKQINLGRRRSHHSEYLACLQPSNPENETEQVSGLSIPVTAAFLRITPGVKSRFDESIFHKRRFLAAEKLQGYTRQLTRQMANLPDTA